MSLLMYACVCLWMEGVFMECVCVCVCIHILLRHPCEMTLCKFRPDQ